MSTPNEPQDRRSQLMNAGGALAKGTGSTLVGFKNFLMRGNLIELATAVIIGAAFNNVVQALVKILLDIIGKIGHKQDFSSVSIGGISLGNFLTALVSFVIVAAVLYFLVITPYTRVRALNAQDKEATVAVTSEDLLTEIRDLLRAQQGGLPPTSTTPVDPAE